MPHFIAPDDITSLMRPTRRKDRLDIHVVSLAVVADNEKDFIDFLKRLKARDAALHSKEENITFYNCTSSKHFEGVVKSWKVARRDGAAKIGGNISARKKEDVTKLAIELIRSDWPKPSSEFSTEELLERAKISLNTAKKHLGRRPIAQANYQAKLKRAAKRNVA